MSRLKEVAKFASGAEAFHAFTHTVFAITGTTVQVFGITETPTVHMWGAFGNAIIALVLGFYAWGRPATVTSGGPPGRAPQARAPAA